MISGSPRPSINTVHTLIDPIRPTMQPVAEEVSLFNDSYLSGDDVDRVDIVECQPPSDIKSAIILEKKMKEKTCTERNDSGFSDCSINSSVNATKNLSAPSNVLTVHPLLSEVNLITEEKIIDREDQYDDSFAVGEKTIDMGANVSVNLLKQKLEKFAEVQENNKKTIPNEKVPKKVSRPASANPILIGKIEVEQKQDLNRSKSIPSMELYKKTESECVDPKILNLNQKSHEQTADISSIGLNDRINQNGQIMRSDFTNTVKMRKKSLEMSVQREKHSTSPRILLEPLGKVTKLLQRFDAQTQSQATSSSPSPSPSISNVIIDEVQDENESGEKRNDFGRDDSDDVFIISEQMPVTSETPPASLIPKSIPFVKPKISVKSIKSTANIESGFKYKQFANTRQKAVTTNTKANVNAFESKIKYTNTATVEINQIATKSMTIVQTKTNNTKSLKNVQKSKIAEAAEHHYKQQITTTTIGSRQITKNIGIDSPKSTVYASFNRTSPVRLSGRVKEVTDRLSTPKGFAKQITTSNCNATSKKAIQFDEQRESMAVETTIENKTNCEFTLRSKMNEGFRKANAFWKAT